MRNLLVHLRGLPQGTIFLCVSFAVLSMATIVLRLLGDGQSKADPAGWMVLSPGTAIRYPWTFLTTSLSEPNPLFMVAGLTILVTIGGFLERQWGVRQYLLFMATTSIISSLISTVLVIILYAVGGSPTKADVLYSTHLGGLAAVVAGFMVALKQLIPEYTIKLVRGRLSFRVNELPGMYTLAAPIVLALMNRLGSVLLVNTGFFVSFVYLRFYRQDGTEMRGDRSEAFAFVTLFPALVQPLMGRVADMVYRLAVAARLITSNEGYRRMAPQPEDLEEGIDLTVVVPEDPGEGEEAETDADRRRALATKALDMRLNENETAK